jgi:hypothetical protein
MICSRLIRHTRRIRDGAAHQGAFVSYLANVLLVSLLLRRARAT